MAEQEKSENVGKISFGFTKKKDTKVLERSTHEGSSHAGTKEETDFVLALEGREVKSTNPKGKEKALVIPLIKRNEYSRHGNKQQDSERTKEKPKVSKMENGTKNSLDIDAVNEIIQDAAQYSENWEGRGSVDTNLSIPILMQNKVPDGMETDEKLDVSIRPDEASVADYDQIPVEHFGMAMLRGMGWKQEEGIGAKMKKAVKPVEAVLRPKGQGLGADRRPGDELNPKRQRKLKPGDKKVEEEPQGFAKGVGVLVMSGSHKNLYGKIEGVDEDNARLVIKLALSGQTVTLSQFNVKIVDKEEYKKFSRDLSRFSKGHDNNHSSKDSPSQKDKHHERRKHNEDADTRQHRSTDHDRHSANHRDRHPDASSRERDSDRHGDRSHGKHRDRHGEEHPDRVEKREEMSHKRRKLEDKYGSGSPDQETHNKTHEESRIQTYWLRPDLRVRFIDKQFKKGRYYNSKVSIVDVVTRSTCTCKTEDGRLLENIDQSMIETLIPKSEMACVMIVAGKHIGQLGSLVKRYKSSAEADVQLWRDRDQIKRLSYDDICEYSGNIHDEDDY